MNQAISDFVRYLIDEGRWGLVGDQLKRVVGRATEVWRSTAWIRVPSNSRVAKSVYLESVLDGFTGIEAVGAVDATMRLSWSGPLPDMRSEPTSSG